MWPSAESTQKLLDAARAGDAEAGTRLLAEHREALRRAIAVRLDPALARRVDASDIVQDVMLEASRRMPTYVQEQKMPFQLWLRHLARDHIIDAHRRHRKAQRRSLDREQPLQVASSADRSSLDLAAAFIDPEKTPAAAAMRQELEMRFLQALTQLDEDDREIIVYRHVEQLSNQDVALMLGLTEAAASMRYLRALRRLRTHLGPDDSQILKPGLPQ